MDRVCREGDGLFPSPADIQLSCSCPDWAGMCKHVAAVLYGIGARLDEKPQLLFVLRDVNEHELLASVGEGLPLAKAAPGTAKLLEESDVAALFGLEMSEAAGHKYPTAVVLEEPQRPATSKRNKPAGKQRSRMKRKKKGARRARNAPVVSGPRARSDQVEST